MKDWWDEAIGDSKCDEFSMSNRREEEYRKLIWVDPGLLPKYWDPLDKGRDIEVFIPKDTRPLFRGARIKAI